MATTQPEAEAQMSSTRRTYARRVFTPEDRRRIVEEAAKTSAADVIRKYGLSHSLLSRWRRAAGVTEVAEATAGDAAAELRAARAKIEALEERIRLMQHLLAEAVSYHAAGEPRRQ